MFWDKDVCGIFTVDDLQLSKDIINVSTPREKIQACFLYDEIILRIRKWVDRMCTEHDSKKDILRSKCKREEGNKVFAGHEPLKAEQFYGEALRYAPHDSPEERLAFANRSAVFMHAQSYQKCLEDVNRALPKSEGPLRLKLLARKCKAACHLGQQEGARRVFEEIKSSNWDIPEEKLKAVVKEIEKELAKEPENLCQETSDVENILPEPFGGFNPDFPYASNNVELRENKEKGKHVIAKKDFDVGSVIFVEKPASHVLLQEFTLDHCQFCCREINAYIPCKTCSKVVFCNENCMDQAWEQFHRFECPNGIELCHNVGIAHLALRMALQKIKFPPSLELVHHLDKMDNEDQRRYVMMAVSLLLFIEREVPDISADFDLGGRLLVHIAELISNGHAINEVVFYNKQNQSKSSVCRVGLEKDVRVATGIFPAASKMNHSCVRHIANCFHGITLIVKAVTPIKAGEEVFNTYGVNCTRMLKDDRLSALKQQYFFDCDCEACSSQIDPAFKCFALKCPKCDSPFMEPRCTTCDTLPSTEYMAEVNNLRNNLSEPDINEPRKTLKLLQRDLIKQRKYFHPYNMLIFESLDTSAMCHILLGQHEEGYKLLKECEEMCIVIYGSFSAELGNQLIKKLDLCMNLLFNLQHPSQLDQDKWRILEQSKGDFVKALQIIDLHFGIWSERYCSLKEQNDIFMNAIQNLNRSKP